MWPDEERLHMDQGTKQALSFAIWQINYNARQK